MKLSRVWPALPALLLALAPVAAAAPTDDTDEFLKPGNWEGRTDIWKIEGKSIVGETTEDPKYNTFFVTKQKYGDFELSFKVQLRDGVGNSGVQVRSALTDEKKFVVKGPQVDVGKGYWGSLYGEGVGGMIQASDPKKIDAVVKPTEFNEYVVTAKGNRVTVKVNGETMVDGDFPTTKDKKPFPADGVIALQAHGGYPKMRVEFKDITFKKLK